MVTFIKDNIKKANFMEKEDIAGQMDLLIKVILFKDPDMDKETGNQLEKEEIFIQELIKMIKNVDMVVMFGLIIVYIKDNSKTI